MGLISPTMPQPGQPRGGEETDLANAVQALLNLVNGNLDAANLAANAVGSSELADGAVATAAKLADGIVGSKKISPGAFPGVPAPSTFRGGRDWLNATATHSTNNTNVDPTSGGTGPQVRIDVPTGKAWLCLCSFQVNLVGRGAPSYYLGTSIVVLAADQTTVLEQPQADWTHADSPRFDPRCTAALKDTSTDTDYGPHSGSCMLVLTAGTRYVRMRYWRNAGIAEYHSRKLQVQPFLELNAT